MAYQIRISPNALRASADRHLTVTAAVDEATARLSNLATALNAAWDGGASQQALSEMNQIRQDIADISTGNSGAAGRLKEIANIFEILDEGIGPVAVPMVGEIANRITSIVAQPIWTDALNWFIANTLRIVPDEVRQVAAQCHQVADELQATAVQLLETAENLSAEWEGKSYNRYVADTREMVSAFRKSASSLDAFATTISKAADRYEALDNSLA